MTQARFDRQGFRSWIQSVRAASACCMLVLILLAWNRADVVSAQDATGSVQPSTVDLKPRKMPQLQPGIVVGKHQEFGYSNLVTFVEPRLASGHIESLPQFAHRYASMFKFTVLADVVRNRVAGQDTFLLKKVGIGFAMDIKGDVIVVTSETANQYGAELGRIDRGVLGGNEACLDDIVQVARTGQLVVFDAEANMLVAGDHDKRVVRHFVWVSPKNGKIGVLVWLMKDTGGKNYEVVSRDMQWLPGGFREDRRIHVSEGGLFSAIPTPDRFALVSLPSGQPVPISAQLRAVAGNKVVTKSELQQMIAGVTDSLTRIRVSQRPQAGIGSGAGQ